jgi:hypothetical protein
MCCLEQNYTCIFARRVRNTWGFCAGSCYLFPVMSATWSCLPMRCCALWEQFKLAVTNTHHCIEHMATMAHNVTFLHIGENKSPRAQHTTDHMHSPLKNVEPCSVVKGTKRYRIVVKMLHNSTIPCCPIQAKFTRSITASPHTTWGLCQPQCPNHTPDHLATSYPDSTHTICHLHLGTKVWVRCD